MGICLIISHLRFPLYGFYSHRLQFRGVVLVPEEQVSQVLSSEIPRLCKTMKSNTGKITVSEINEPTEAKAQEQPGVFPEKFL